MIARLCRTRAHAFVLAALAAFASLLLPYLAFAQGQPGPTVVSVDVSGNAHVPTDKILSVVRTKPGTIFDERTLREDLQNIFDLGYFQDQVPPLIRQRPDGIAITFRVIENPVITKIVFSGNDHVPADTLLALMDTGVGQVLNTNTFHQDVLKINSYYDKIGYQGQVQSHVNGLNITKDGVLSLNIREGLTVRNIIIKPGGLDTVLRPDIIKSVLALKEGAPYSEDTRDKDYENVKKLYEKYDLQIGDFEAGIDPSSVDNEKGTADVVYTIYAARVGAVQITGNTVTKDEVIRRQLRLKPGQLITQGALRRDYENLNNLGFFEKVELNPKPGPNPKKPYEVTLDWNVKEQRTGTAQIGAGYSGGPTGEGLTGTLSYSQNNINGTGNGASIRIERGARVADASIQYSVPYLGDTPRSQKYSFTASIFTQDQTNYYQTYDASASQAVAGNPVISTPAPTGAGGTTTGATGTIPVVLTPNQNVAPAIATYDSRANGVSGSLGRRLSDYVSSSFGLSAQRIASDVLVGAPYYLAGTQVNQFNAPITANPFDTTTATSTLGIAASSIANTSTGQGYTLTSAVVGLSTNTEDDYSAPRRGAKASLTDELSGKVIGSQFSYSELVFDGAQFYPVGRLDTLGFHAVYGTTTGAIPPNKLFVLSDQQLRGYSEVFYGTEELLLQSELRVPLTPDRKFGLAFFGDYGALRIRGAQPILDTFGNVVVDYNKFLYHGDVGVGIRFDVPQLGFKSIRLDFAKGKGTTHTSFGIGQSF